MRTRCAALRDSLMQSYREFAAEYPNGTPVTVAARFIAERTRGNVQRIAGMLRFPGHPPAAEKPGDVTFDDCPTKR